ncbi:MAG: imidazole glycerol phosphate synthase subunit HisH [Flavobacteriaceae bacterium]|nr:imidazole glycerol phosphate synthase subunit HisH [Flavobacteriaceae bacterium]
MKIVIVDYGVGNIQSLKFAIERLGYQARLTESSEEILNADKVFFPGVGEAKNAMAMLKDKGLDQTVRQLKVPTLGICLGMQLMCQQSEEGNTQGLGLLPCVVKRFESNLKVPQIGWNHFDWVKGDLFQSLKPTEYMYSVHSYYVPLGDWTIACSDYGTPYSSALQIDNFYGVQFHPEKSSFSGSQLLLNFLKL